MTKFLNYYIKKSDDWRPIKSNIMLITFASLLFAVRFILGFFSFSVGPTVLSFTWISLFMAGFLLGPIYGFLWGVIVDSFGFLISRGSKIWMWQYAMQEPLICLLGGLLYILWINMRNNKNQWILYFIYETIVISATIFATTMIIINFDASGARDINSTGNSFKTATATKQAGIVLMIMFCITASIFPIYRIKKQLDASLIMIITLLVMIPWIIFSWSFGAIFYVEYFKRIYTDREIRSDWLIFYSLSRILKGMFVIPIEIFVTYTLMKAVISYSKKSQVINM